MAETFTFSGYGEVYFGYDFDSPANHERPFFLYSHKRHNEVNVNLAYAKVNYQSAKVRGNLALMSGSYAQYNLANEPNLLQHFYEANIGVKLSKSHNIWLDAGIMPSHIGFESAVSADCWTASRSMAADNSPYYETGIKVTATTKKENFFVSILYLNGWQRIKKPDNINSPSFGVQLNYKPMNNLTLNYSNFIGTDKPDISKSVRTYHNLYAIYEPSANWGFIAGVDIGTEKDSVNPTSTWYSPVFMAKYSFKNTSKVAFRTEYYDDKKEVLLYTSVGFQTWGLSLNYDYAISKNGLFRLEAKEYFANYSIFKNHSSYNNFAILSSICLKL
ncbi:MAG: hypothetical protein RI894_2007 [Bacteroidota bacterium]